MGLNEKVLWDILVGCWGCLVEIGSVVVMLVSLLSSFIIGVIICIDGGYGVVI